MLTPRQILAAIDKYEPRIAAAFRGRIAMIRTRAQVKAMAVAIEAGDLAAVARVMGISEAGWSVITESTRTAFAGGGAFAASDAPVSLGFVFDMNNVRAEQWLIDHSSQFVTAVNADQIAAIQSTMEAASIAGRNPRSTALDIIGRISKTTGKRQGGIVGLTRQQAGYISHAQPPLGLRQQLASGDPKIMRKYFNRTRRDKRFDSIVRRAIAAETPVAAADINRLAARYSDRLLQTRGTNIARTEALSAFNAGSDEAIRQAVDAGIVNPESMIRTWDAAGDDRVRDQHRGGGLDGQVRGFGEPFQAPDGSFLMHPGDRSLGAGAGQIINCRCAVIEEIDWIALSA